MTDALADNRTRSLAWRIFLTCWLVYAAHFATNTVREIYPALSLGDHLSLDVSEYVGLHPDIFTIPGRGAYINNNPGASLLGAIPYALTRPLIDRAVETVQQERQLSGAPAPAYDSIYPLAREFYREAYARGLDVKFALGAGVMQALLMAPLSALGVVTMFYILYVLTRRQRAAILLALLYGIATPIFYRTAQLNQNVLIANFALFAWAVLWRPWDDAAAPRKPHYLLAGLLCGWTLVLDYSGAVVVLALSLYAWSRQRSLPVALRRTTDLIEYGVGLLASISVLLICQWVAFGHPFLAAQHYMPATQYSVIGYNGITWPQPDLLWQTAFGLSFGLFTSAPLLLLTLYPPAWRKGLRITGRAETWLILGLTLALFLFSAANQYGRLQFNSGVRYMVPALPFLFLIAAGVLLKLPGWLAAGFGLAGAYWSWCLTMYRDVEQGLGILESLVYITTEGPRLPWLVTLQRLGFIADARPYSTLILLLCAVSLALLWGVHIRRISLRAIRHIAGLAILLLVISSSAPLGVQGAANTTIVLDPRTTYQTITGWEATAQAGQIACEPADMVKGNPTACAAYLKYRDALMDQAVNELGLTRVRVEIKPGVENPVDNFQRFLEGQITQRDWNHVYSPGAINDNADAKVIGAAGFHWSSVDNVIDNVVLPLRTRLAARGEKLFVNVCYVGFGTNPTGFYHWDQPAEYAEFVLATYQHMKAKYGFVPDAWEVELEPDNTAFNGTKMGQAIAATAALLEANGFTPNFIAPSTTNMTNAQSYFNAIKAVIGDTGVRKYIGELSYHRYAGVNDAVLQWIGTTSRTYGIGASMLEHIGSGYEALHQDLKVGNNTAWEQFTLAFPVEDNGAQYYTINASDAQNPKPQMGWRTKFLRQYFKFIRPGAVRIGATGDATFDPIAFIHPGNRYVVVVKAASGGPFSIQNLPPGEYGIKYTTGSAYDVSLPNVKLAAGQSLNASIPAAGAITIYFLSAPAPPQKQRCYLPMVLKPFTQAPSQG